LYGIGYAGAAFVALGLMAIILTRQLGVAKNLNG
jgi:hypothetical protein